MADKTVLYEVKREEEFAPVKNAPGSSSDTPEDAFKAYTKRCRTWLEACREEKNNVIDEKEGIEPPIILLSPLQAYNRIDDNILKEIVSNQEKNEWKLPIESIFG